MKKFSKTASSGSAHIKEIAERKPFPAFVLVLAPDEVRRRRVCDHLIESILEKNHPRGAVTKLKGSDVTSSSMRSLALDLQMGSLFHPVRVWTFDRVEQFKIGESRELSISIGKLAPSHHVLALGEALPATNPLRALAQREKTLIELPELKGMDLSRWVERELSVAKIEVADSSVVETLIELGESQPDQIARQIELAALFCNEEKLTSSMLRDLFPGRYHPSDYDLLDALTQGDFAKAERLLISLEADDRSPYMLSSFITRSWAQLTEARHLSDSGMNEAEIRNQMGLSPWIASKVLQQARKLSRDAVMHGLETLLWTDSRLKGRNNGPSSVLSQTAWRLTSS